MAMVRRIFFRYWRGAGSRRGLDGLASGSPPQLVGVSVWEDLVKATDHPTIHIKACSGDEACEI